MRVLLAILLAAAPVAAHAQAGTPASSPTPAPNAPIVVQGQAEKKVCHMETATGSIMSRRVCRTAREIAEQERRTEVALEAVRQARESADLIRELRENGAN